MITPNSQARRRDWLRNRAAILDAGEAEFREHGERVGMHSVAAAAGVGIGTLYRHFATKAELLEEISTRRTEALLEASARAIREEDAADACRQLFAQVGRSKCDPVFVRYLPSDPADDAQRALAAFQGNVSTILRRAQDDGVADGSLTPADLLALLYGYLQTLEFAGGTEADVERFAAVYSRALAAAPLPT